MPESEPRVVIFACNWNALENLESAGKQRLNYPSGVRLLKLDCLGQIGPSAILKAYEKGADGVMLIGCAPEECHYEFGGRRAQELYAEVRKLVGLLGLGEERLLFHQVHTGKGPELVERVRAFVEQLSGVGPVSS
jgi:coenzyme F420-reducing hydrogenase delta subunit